MRKWRYWSTWFWVTFKLGFSLLGRNRIIWAAKCWNCTHKNPCNLELLVSCIGRDRILRTRNWVNAPHRGRYTWDVALATGHNSTFSPPNRTRWAHQKAGTLSSVDLRTCHNSLFLATKVQKLSSHWAMHPCGVWMATRHQSHFQGAKVQKTSSHQARYPWGLSLPNCRCIVKRLINDCWTIVTRFVNDC